MFFAISAMDVDIDTYPAGVVVNFHCLGGTIVPGAWQGALALVASSLTQEHRATRTTDICAIGAQSCVTIEVECSYVMVR